MTLQDATPHEGVADENRNLTPGIFLQIQRVRKGSAMSDPFKREPEG